MVSFADDTYLLASSAEAFKNMTLLVAEEMGEDGWDLNVDKCTCLAANLLFPHVEVNGQSIQRVNEMMILGALVSEISTWRSN